jgi:hypothetical protein
VSADTRPEVAEWYARLIMSQSPQRRVAMCFEMSAGARALVRQSLEQAGLVGDQLADALVKRLYGNELSPRALLACQARVRGKVRGATPP